AHRVIHEHLDALNDQLYSHQEQCEVKNAYDPELDKRLSEWREEDESSVRMVLQQLHLIYRMLPELHT
ncbi:hypothetical protein, partial [Vibrio sp. 10N.222.52.B7]